VSNRGPILRKPYTLKPELSPGRRAWLEQLEADGPAARGRGPIGYQCMRLGWTQWERDAQGVITGRDQITEVGRRMLRIARSLEQEGDQ
jgi:hypothetical protein